MNIRKLNQAIYSFGFMIILFSAAAFSAEQTQWKSQEVDWNAGPGGKIKSIRYPVSSSSDKKLSTETNTGIKLMLNEPTATAVLDNTIDSPPVAGFVPQIVVAVTDRRSDEFDWVAQTETSVKGRFLTSNPKTDYIIGLFDTGAGAHIISNAGAHRSGVYSSHLVTENLTEILGATNSVFARVSQPLAVFVDGLGAIDPNTRQIDYSNMFGQSNVAVMVGDEPEPNQPDLPTVIGSPFSVNFVTAIFNDRQITLTRDGNDFTSPEIRFYEHFDTDIPDYQRNIPLNLIPAGGVNIQYIPNLDSIYDLVFEPGTPSIIIGNAAQSLFFVNSVDLNDGTRSSIDNDRFMLDTGAQITVVGKNIGARLGLNPAEPDFEVEIQDVTGETTINPGFFIDSLEIAALGEWFSFTNVPVVMLDVTSPEGGYLDGIIGMNLFTEFNLVLHGGGLQGDDAPFLALERIAIRLKADIAPGGGDGIVNFLDYAAFSKAWQTTPDLPNWNSSADFNSDGVIDMTDMVEFSNDWLKTTEP
jgi:hypothetical protein